MSYKLVDAVFYLGLPRAEKQVLMSLCKHAHDDGSSAFPSVELIHFETGLKRRAIQNALRWLEDRQYIVAERSKKGGRAKSVRYRVLVPDAELVRCIELATKRAVSALFPDEKGAVSSEKGAVSATKSKKGAVSATKGAVSAPEAVKNQSEKAIGQSVRQQIVDGLTDVFYSVAGKNLNLSAKQRENLEQVAADVPADVLRRAIKKFAEDSHDWSKVKQPGQLLCKRLNDYIRQVRADDFQSALNSGVVPQEVLDEERARSLETAHMTEEDFAVEVEGMTIQEFAATPRGRKYYAERAK
jgi:predicted transcriptional regulator